MEIRFLVLSLFAAALFAGCQDDDQAVLVYDFCQDSPSSENCRSMAASDWGSIEEVEELILGRWELVARANSWFEPFCENLSPSERDRFQFFPDGRFVYESSNGETETSTYQVLVNNDFRPGFYFISFDENTLENEPFFMWHCNGYSFFDFRASDGNMEVYVKIN